ncbi:MAG: hypothetical protein ACQESG_06925 [Nanobdellota archaeon]
MAILEVLIGFLISLVVSAIIIYLATKLFGEDEGFSTAVLASLIGAVIFGLASYLLGVGLIASLIGGVAWLIALGSLYNMGWLKSLAVAAVIWIISAIVSLVMPTVGGPL